MDDPIGGEGGRGEEGNVGVFKLAMCRTNIKFPTLPLVTSTTKTHPPTEPISVGNFIYSGKYLVYLF